MTVEGTGFAVRFDAVANDSRCPADAVCVTLGDAEAVFTVTTGGRPSVPLTLHTAPGEGQRASVGSLRLTLTHLDPYPYSDRPVSAGDLPRLAARRAHPRLLSESRREPMHG